MLASSTGLCPGFWLLVIQPASVLPSNNRIQPSSFSRSVSSLSAAARGAAPSITTTKCRAKRLVRGGQMFKGELSGMSVVWDGEIDEAATDDSGGCYRLQP